MSDYHSRLLSHLVAWQTNTTPGRWRYITWLIRAVRRAVSWMAKGTDHVGGKRIAGLCSPDRHLRNEETNKAAHDQTRRLMKSPYHSIPATHRDPLRVALGRSIAGTIPLSW